MICWGRGGVSSRGETVTTNLDSQAVMNLFWNQDLLELSCRKAGTTDLSTELAMVEIQIKC